MALTSSRMALLHLKWHLPSVWLSSDASVSEAESSLKKLLSKRFPKATHINVEDISGGCGSMYQIHVEAPDFANLRRVKQHQLVTECLKEQIKDMHGLRIDTAVSKSS